MKAFLRPGMRMSLMENRDVWYFLHVTSRAQDSKMGFIKEIDGNSLTLERPQSASSALGVFDRSGGVKQDDGFVHLTYEKYPHRTAPPLLIEPDALVRINDRNFTWKQAALVPDKKNDHVDPVPDGPNDGGAGWTNPTRGFARSVLESRDSLLVQAARDRMRVELIPPGYGDWAGLVNNKLTKLDLSDNRSQTVYQFLGLITGEMETRFVNVSPPHFDGPKFQDARGFPSYRLAGNWIEPDDPIEFRPIYYKGENVIVDGFYAYDTPEWNDPGLGKPGRFTVCFTRRDRIATDRFAYTADDPVAWGEITAINGTQVSLLAPVVDGAPISGEQVIDIPADADGYYLGTSRSLSDVLQVGNWIHVYPPRPQTLLVGRKMGASKLDPFAMKDGTETGAVPVEFLLVRGTSEGNASFSITFGGTASTSDYSVAGATIIDAGTGAATVDFADGEDARTITLTPLSDSEVEGTETVELSVGSEDAAHELHVSASAEILDAQTDYAPQVELVSPVSGSLVLAGAGASTTLEASVTDDGVLAPTIQWSHVTGPATPVFGSDAALLTTATFPAAGEYTIRVAATDDQAQSSQVDIDVSVLAPNAPPVASIRQSTEYGVAPLLVTLNGAFSSDSDGDELSYEWTFTDGSTMNGPVVSYVFSGEPIQMVTLKVDDGRGGSHTTTATIVLEPDSSLAIWQEHFDEWANGTTADMGATPWSASGANMSVRDGRLQSFNSTATWTSGVIDISSGEALVLMDISAAEEQIDATDDVTVSYRLDGGSWIEHKVLSELELDSGHPVKAAIPSLIGSALELRVRVRTSSNTEFVFLDNVEVFITSGEPRLSVSAEGPANEWGPEGVDFVIDRILNTSDTFTAHFSLGGSSVGADYNVTGATAWNPGSRTGTVQFVGGELQKTITVTPINDSIVEGTETVQMTLQPGANYTLGTTTVQADILDAQTNYAPFLTLVNPTVGSLTLASENETANLEISATDDRSPVLAYQWTKVSGPGTVTFGSETSEATTADFSTFGEYVIRVTVTDGDSIDAAQDYAVTVIDSLNNAPTGVISSDVVAGSAPLTVSFDGTGSTDPDLDTLTYSWNFGDGGSSTDASPTHTFTTQGVYNVQLTVNDGRTGSDTTSVVINVGTPAAPGNIIWQETFADLSNGSTEDTGSTAWSLNNADGKMSVQNGAMVGSNLDAAFTWTSEAVDISSGTANIAVDLKSPPSAQLDAGQDFVRVGYRLDGGTLVVAQTYDGPIDDDWVTFVQTGLTGASLEVVVQVNNSSTNEKYFFDNVTVRVEAASGYSDATFDDWYSNLPPGVTVDDTRKGFDERANGRLTNGEIFAFGIDSLDPVAAAGKLPSVQLTEVNNEQYLEMTFRRRSGGSGNIIEESGYSADGVTYIVQCSNSLAVDDWHSGAAIIEITNVIDHADGTESVTVRSKQAGALDSERKEFMRVRVIQE